MRLLLPCLLLALTGPVTWAQLAPAGNLTTPPKAQTFYSRIRGVFDFDLPSIDPPGTVKLIFNPHIGDLLRRDYLRVDSGFRWAINDHCEISPGAAIYFTHGLGDTKYGSGVGGWRLGSKYIIRQWPDANYETSVFLNVEVPFGQAPVDMTDGLNHVAPGFLVQHHSTRYPKLTTFTGAGLDLVTDRSVAGTPVSNQPSDDSVNFNAGAIYDLGQIKWTLSTTFATTAGLGETTRNYFYLRPGLIWFVPKRYTFSKTQWIVGLGARASWGPDGTELSFTSRVRAEITFRQVLDKILPRKPDAEVRR